MDFRCFEWACGSFPGQREVLSAVSAAVSALLIAEGTVVTGILLIPRQSSYCLFQNSHTRHRENANVLSPFVSLAGLRAVGCRFVALSVLQPFEVWIFTAFSF